MSQERGAAFMQDKLCGVNSLIYCRIQIEEDSRDEVMWALDKSKTFTTKSQYRFVTHRGVCFLKSDDIWHSKLPLKIKIFLWQLKHNKLQSAVSLKRRG
jgi:hypothetical protein